MGHDDARRPADRLILTCPCCGTVLHLDRSTQTIDVLVEYPDREEVRIGFGDGLLCATGNLLRLYLKIAIGGVVSAPTAGDPSVSARSAALGDPIPLGATRHYQIYYRDPNLAFCPSPTGSTWNASNALSAVWAP